MGDRRAGQCCEGSRVDETDKGDYEMRRKWRRKMEERKDVVMTK